MSNLIRPYEFRLYAKNVASKPIHSPLMGELKNARRFAEQEVSLLLIHAFMSDGDAEQVLAAGNSWTGSQTSCTLS